MLNDEQANAAGTFIEAEVLYLQFPNYIDRHRVHLYELLTSIAYILLLFEGVKHKLLGAPVILVSFDR